MSGVAYIHGMGIAHRDLKLENILVVTYNNEKEKNGTLYYKEGSTDARPMNISSVEDHGYRYDIFKIDDGVTTVTNTNSVTVSIKLSGGDDFITVSQRFELHSK